MKIIIPSYARAKTIKSHLMPQIREFDWMIVVHNDEQRTEYLKNPTLPPEKIIVSGQPVNLSLQRNWIRDNIVAKDEWFLTMNDNIEKINIIPETHYNNKSLPKPAKNDRQLQIYLEEHYPDRFKEVIDECLQKCEELNTGLCGFSAHENYFYRTNKWKRIATAVGRMFMVKNDELRCDPNIFCMEDYDYSVQAIIRYGGILVNNFIYPFAKFNQPGGLGIFSERAAKKVKDCEIITNKYPGLFRYKARKNSSTGAEIVLRGYTESFYRGWYAKYSSKQVQLNLGTTERNRMDYEQSKIKGIIRESIVANYHKMAIKRTGNPYAGVEHVGLDHSAINTTTDEIYDSLNNRGVFK